MVRDPVCAFRADMGCVYVVVKDETPRSTYQGRTYYFCSESCKEDFENPEKFLQGFSSLLPSDRVGAAEGPTDPVCENRVRASDAFVTAIWRGREYYFCSDHCRDKFLSAPERYAQKQADR